MLSDNSLHYYYSQSKKIKKNRQNPFLFKNSVFLVDYKRLIELLLDLNIEKSKLIFFREGQELYKKKALRRRKPANF